MPDQHLIIDIGPGVLPLALAFFGFLSATIAGYYSYQNGRKIDTANSHLAVALSKEATAKAAATAADPIPNITKSP